MSFDAMGVPECDSSFSRRRKKIPAASSTLKDGALKVVHADRFGFSGLLASKKESHKS